MVIDKELYICPKCKGGLFFNDDLISCRGCSVEWKIKEGVPCFISEERYWCNYPQDLMVKLNQMATEKGWGKAVETLISYEIKESMERTERADARFFLPINKESIILDAGCMWGEITIPLAKYVKRIIGIDSTFETLRFLDIRSSWMGLTNIELACADLLNLPFPEEKFDIVIINGVLEWLGYKRKFVVSKDYGKKGSNFVENKKEDPYKLQMQGLREAYRVLKRGGTLFIGIENRYGYQYFYGVPDDHSGIRFTNLLPRKIANIYMKWKLNQEYKTYTYSYKEHIKNLRQSGFKEIKFYGAFPSYREPNIIASLENGNLIKYYYEYIKFPEISQIKTWIMRIILNLGLGKYTVPSFLIIAKK